MYFIFVLYLATVFASSHEKYIDLLPEEEKQEFLDRVMRRIMDNVKTKVNATTSSENISDEQLKKQDELVRAMIKEESKHIEMVKGEKVGIKDNIAKNINVKSLRTIHRQDHSNADNLDLVPVDLTVNDDQRRRSELTKEKFTEELSKDVNNTVSTIQKRSVQVNVTGNDSEDKLAPKEPDQNESNIDELKHPTVDTLTTEINVKNIIPISPITVNDNVSQEIKNENVSNVEKDTESGIEIGEEIKPATETYIDAITNKGTTLEPDTNVIKVESLHKKVTEKKIIHIKTVTKNSNKNLKNNKSDYVFQYNTTISEGKNDREIDFQIIKDSTFLSNLTDEGTTETIKKTTAYDKIFSKIIFPKSIPNVIHNNNIKKSQIELQTHSKLSDLVSEALEEARDEYKKKYSRDEEYKSFLNSQINPTIGQAKFDIKRYRVYEVDVSPSSKNLLRNDEPMVEQPRYVPVYEYSPNKAYFNPDNRYGPNADDDQSIYDILLRKGEESNKSDDEGSKADDNDDYNEKDSESKTDYKSHVEKFALYHAHTTRVPINTVSTTVKRKKHKKNKPDHQNNIDTDGSDQIHFPDSYEHLHPYNNMEGGMKSHIEAVREILYNNGIVGEVQHKNKYKDYLDDMESKKELLRSNKFQFDIGGYKIVVFKNDDKSNDNKMKKKSLTKSFKPIDTRIESKTKMNTISKIIQVTDENDVFLNLNKLKDMNINLMRRNNDMKLKVYLKAVKNLIDEDSEALKQYDWLSSTVQIQSALTKLKDLLQRFKESKPIHPSDVQILKYMVFLHGLSLEIRDATNFRNQLRKKYLLPRNKKKHNKIIKEKGLMNRVWLYLRSKLPALPKNGITKLEEFVLNIENGLYDLHDALKNIALITKYNNQNWYSNLKDLYLSTGHKHLNEILLHLSTSRLFELIENSCENGLKDDFIKYMKNHRKEGKITLNEMLFIVRILDEINNKNLK